MRYIKVFRCRLCCTLYDGRAMHQGTEASLAATQHALSENSYEGLEHDEHLCEDGGVGIADLAGYQLERLCEWKRVAGNEESGMYYISCGEIQLIEGLPVDSQPCPYCRKPIKVTTETGEVAG